MKCYCDRFLYVAIFIAHLLLYVSFTKAPNFWLVFSLSLLVLIIIAIKKERLSITGKWEDILKYSIPSGILIYLFFALGKNLIILFEIPLLADLQQLYQTVQPTDWWHYIVLAIVIIPGEEIFWRGYIQKRLSYYVTPIKSVIYASLLYATAHIYANSILLILAAIIAGMVWGFLYQWKKNLWISIVSHLVFNMMLLVLFPLL